MMDLLHENRFLRILWDEKARIIRLDWQEATSAMSDDDFKNALALFAGHVEEKRLVEFWWMCVTSITR
jgi:hypothetical protein